MNEIRGIQFVGTQRSGSNLLRLMLNRLNEVDAPHPPHILKTIYPLLPAYGDLSNGQGFIDLIRDTLCLIKTNPISWEKFDPGISQILARCSTPSPVEAFRVLYSMKAEASGAKFWCCKSMANIHYVEQLEANGVSPFYLHIYRDGRDVAASFKKTMVGHKHIYFLARQWQKEQQLANALKTRFKSRFIQVRYEDLITNPKAACQAICRRLDIKYQPEMLTYHQSKESHNAATAGKMWENLSRPVINNNCNKFLQVLTEKEILIFESLAGEMLEKHGYKRMVAKNRLIKAFSPDTIKGFEHNDRLLKVRAIGRADKNDIARRSSQEHLKARLVRKLKHLTGIYDHAADKVPQHAQR